MNTYQSNVSFQSVRVSCSKAKTRLLLAALLPCLIGSVWAQALRDDILPEDTIAFQGSLVATEHYQDYIPVSPPGDPPFFPWLFVVTASGTTSATALGQLTVINAGMADYISGAGPQFSRFIDANGESIFTTATRQASETRDPRVKSMLEFHTVTGGTGYFSHVNGTFTVKRLIKFSADGLTGHSEGNFNGYLRLR